MTDELNELRQQNAALHARLATIEGSLAWQLVAPIQRFVFRHPGLRLLLWLLAGRFGRIRAYLVQRRLARTLLRLGLFDAGFYRSQRPDTALCPDPLLHYVQQGLHEGLWPNPLFDPAFIAARAGVPLANALPHVLQHGGAPHPLFDPAHYSGQVPEARSNPLGHFLAHAAGDPNPDFDVAWYRQRYDTGAVNPLLHFLAADDGRETNGRRVAALRTQQAMALGTAIPSGPLVVGIVTFNTPAAMLQRVARSVRIGADRAGIAVEILLLDNGGPASDALPELRTLPAQGNIGFGAGHNRLMQAAWEAGARYYLALNPDAALHPDALGALLRMAHAAQDRVLVQAAQFPAEHPVTYDPATFETPWISGACMLLPRIVVDAIGEWDDGFFMYCEDVDLSWRARAAGFRTLTCPAALLFHPITNRVLDRATQRMFLDSGLRLALKWGTEADAADVRAQMAYYGLQPPTIGDVTPMDAPGIADFSHGFSFAACRWS